MKKNQGSDYSELLIWAAALVTVVRYAAAFIASDATEINAMLSEFITIAMGISGLGMGVLDVIGGAYLFTGWQKKMPANGQAWSFRFKVLSFFAVGLIVNGILILIPFTASRVSGDTMFHILGDGFFLYAWSAVVNVAPYLLIGGVAVGNNVVGIDASKNDGHLSGQLSGTSGQKSDNNQSDIKVTDWRSAKKKLTGQQIHAIAQSKTSDIMKMYSLSDRTARRWIEAAKKETPPPIPLILILMSEITMRNAKINLLQSGQGREDNMLLRMILAAGFIFVGFLLVAIVWYYISAVRDSTSGLTKEQKKELWRAFISGEL